MGAHRVKPPLANYTREVTYTRQDWCDELDTERPTHCLGWQGVSNLKPPTWKSQAQTTGPPRARGSGICIITRTIVVMENQKQDVAAVINYNNSESKCNDSQNNRLN